MENPEVRSICEALSAEPLFHLSLHSKELFHSNLLGWFCEKHPDAASGVFARWVPQREGSSGLMVQRERGHLDLAVELPGLAPFIVENKVFAPPDEAQLDEYAAGGLAGLVEPTLVLLSLGRPMWDSGTYRSASGLPWRHLSYADLANALDEVVENIGGFDGELIAHYCSFIRTLHQLADVAGHVEEDDPIAVDHQTATLLRTIRLHDAVGKLRARVAIAAARSHTMPQLTGQGIHWKAGFTNGLPLVEAFLDRGDGDSLGWQYQDPQWRVVAITSHHQGRTDELRNRRHAYVAERYADWLRLRDPLGQRGVDGLVTIHQLTS